MADKKRFRIKDRNGTVVPFDIAVEDITIDGEHKSLPQKLAEMAASIVEASQSWTPTEESIAMANLTQAVQALLAKAGSAVQPADLSPINEAITTINRAIDAITGTTDTTDLIDSLNEVVDFLTGIENDETLSGKLLALQNAIDDKQDALTFDQAPTAGSDRPVKSGGVYAALEEKADNASVQTALLNLQMALLNVYTKQEVSREISQMQATIEQQQLTVITGDRLSLWLDEDGESINIMAGEVPDIAAAPTISHVINNDGTATVTITNNEQGATIHYTTNGDAPTESSSVYSSALTINTAGSHTIKAIAIIQDKMNSSVATDTFSVVSCQTPVIAVDNSASNTATVTATAGSGESVSLSVGGQTATGTTSASVTINKGSEPQTLTAVATATYTGKLSATITDNNVRIEEKAAHVFSAHKLGGKAVAGTTQGDIQVTLNNSFANQAATITEEDGVIWWEIDCANQVYLGTTLQNEVDRSSSIFSAGAAKILTIEHIPDECTIINNAYVFAGCTALTQFKVGNSGLATFANTLAGNTSLKVVVLPSTVTSLNSGFSGCTALESVTAPGVKEIINNVFSGCSALTTCVLGQLTRIDKEGFKGCSSLNFANVDFGHVGTIGVSAFEGCTNLKSAVLVSTTLIKSSAFKSAGLTSLTLPETLPEGVSLTIEGTAFYNCKMTSVDIPGTVTSIGGSAFESATHMKEFHIKKVIASSSEAASVAGNGLNKPVNSPTIYVPVGTSGYYQAAWAAYTSLIVEEPNS